MPPDVSRPEARDSGEAKPAKSKHAKEPEPVPLPLSELLRLPAGTVDLSRLDPRATPGLPGSGKADAVRLTEAMGAELSELQERLYATGRVGDPEARRVLVILQGMDTSGKGGVIRHAIGMVDPQGVQIKAFKAPTKVELSHDFLWRVQRELPLPGAIGIFDRSHYEDVLVVRVHALVEESVWSRRYDQINAWEEALVASGTVVVKCFLHISSDKQKERLQERLDHPDKYWKYNPGDLTERALWPQYAEAYEAALERCSTQHAPWFVIPSDRKWYRNWAVAQLLTEHLRVLDLAWPEPDFDVAVERVRLAAT
jgi:PPK2 family polyphosphate:nucleotide phosphotransferase